MVQRLKNDVQMQQQVDQAIKALDRPYLRGKPGKDKNITGGLKDYFPVNVGHYQIESEENEWLAEAPIFKNEKRWIAQTIFPEEKTPSRLAYEK